LTNLLDIPRTSFGLSFGKNLSTRTPQIPQPIILRARSSLAPSKLSFDPAFNLEIENKGSGLEGTPISIAP
jgi:hypothetical protein